MGIFNEITEIVKNYWMMKQNKTKQKQTSLTGRQTTIEQKRFLDFLNNMDLILNSIQGHSAILCLKKEVRWLQAEAATRGLL